MPVKAKCLLDRVLDCISPEPMSGCWLWIPAAGRNGYTTMSVGNQIVGSSRGWKIGAHVISYQLFKGPVPIGCDLDHLCRNPQCVNPDHLEAVTHRENVRRGDAGKHNAVKTHCPRGHEYTAINTKFFGKYNSRACRICSTEDSRRRRAKIRGLFRAPAAVRLSV